MIQFVVDKFQDFLEYVFPVEKFYEGIDHADRKARYETGTAKFGSLIIVVRTINGLSWISLLAIKIYVYIYDRENYQIFQLYDDLQKMASRKDTNTEGDTDANQTTQTISQSA